jgi:hypothetical protein
VILPMPSRRDKLQHHMLYMREGCAQQREMHGRESLEAAETELSQVDHRSESPDRPVQAPEHQQGYENNTRQQQCQKDGVKQRSAEASNAAPRAGVRVSPRLHAVDQGTSHESTFASKSEQPESSIKQPASCRHHCAQSNDGSVAAAAAAEGEQASKKFRATPHMAAAIAVMLQLLAAAAAPVSAPAPVAALKAARADIRRVAKRTSSAIRSTTATTSKPTTTKTQL